MTAAAAALSGTPWRLGSAAVVLLFALDPFGAAPSAAALAVVMLAAIQVFVAKRLDDRINVALLVLSGLIVIIAVLEILHPNVPSLTVGLLGFRKSATFVLGIAIGLGWRGARLPALRLTWWCMFATAAVSLFVHLVLPSVERSITRNAGMYTALIGGESRMQGLLAGPFHVSMLGVFLFLTALTPGIVIQQRWVRLLGAVVGFACVYFSQVRTGLVALAIGMVVLTIFTGSLQRWVSRLLVAVALVILGLVYIEPLTSYASQFTALRTLLERGFEDTRFTHRFTSWTTSLDMIDQSPLVGYGSGSAGDTLAPYFLAGDHVTSHNTFMKYAVEGGVVQALLVASLCIGLMVAVRPRRDRTHFGVIAGVTFLVFAFVGAAPESLPVAFGLAVVWGLCARRQPTTSDDAVPSAEIDQGPVRDVRSVHLIPDVGTGAQMSSST